MAASNIMGALVAFIVTSLLTQPQLEGFGWRLPFVFGLLIAPVGLWIRSTLDETPEFKREAVRQLTDPVHPLKELLATHKLAVLRGWALSIMLTVSSYTLVIFMPTYVQRTFGYLPKEAFAASLVGNVLMVACCVLAGIASDRIGRRAVLAASAVWLVVLVHPLVWLVQTQHSLGTLVIVQCLLCIGVGGFVGVAPAALAELFPARVRSTGVSLCYNLAVTIFSGFAPAVLSFLTGRGGVFAPGWYVIIAACLAAPAVFSLKAGRSPVPSTTPDVSPSRA